MAVLLDAERSQLDQMYWAKSIALMYVVCMVRESHCLLCGACREIGLALTHMFAAKLGARTVLSDRQDAPINV